MLNVYRASAGSGKTFTLTCEYIKMLLGCRYYDDSATADNNKVRYSLYNSYTNSHRRILAVTFTNKATDEMKRRIIEELEILARDVTSSLYCDDLCTTFNCGTAALQKSANEALSQMLNDYSYFNVSTIDSFFQQVLRAFTREIGLQGGYELELDSDYVTMLAIDRMFAELENDGRLLNWLLRYAEENISNEGSWNIRESNRISTLAKQLMQDEYKKNREKLSNITLEDYENYHSELKMLREECVSEIVATVTTLTQPGGSADLMGSNFKKTLAYFQDASNLRNIDKRKIDSLKKYREDAGKCFPDTYLRKTSYTASQLHDGVAPSLIFIFDKYKEMCSIDASIEYIYALGVLTTIDKYIAQYEYDHNTILLSKTPEVLQGLISGSDTPFIYERVGSRIAHYMIDEFQDTSRIQWDNFTPLINNSLASDDDNLIVGDVKQSIYRWRNGDWRLLHEELSHMRGYNDMMTTRDTNWRSYTNIVAFNNAFFKNASRMLCNELKLRASDLPDFTPLIDEIYENAPQYVAPKYKDSKGHISVRIFTSKDDDFTIAADEQVKEVLEQLLQKGYNQRDILFLVRTNKQCIHLVEMLLTLSAEHDGVLRNLRVISNESLLINNAPPVKLILGILRYLLNPSLSLNKLILNFQYELINEKNESVALKSYFDRVGEGETMDADLKAFVERISQMSLYEMCENIICHFGLSRIDTYVAYIEAFQDMVVDYCRSHPSDLYSFLSWWKAKEDKMTVKLPENLDAVRVMTIHKSKGLASPVVIVPYANWFLSSESNAQNQSLKWLEPTVAPFNKIPILPITHKSALAGSIYAKDYYYELRNEYIDNLNAAYVAFTRAKYELYIFSTTRKDSKGDEVKIGKIGELIRQSLCCDAAPDSEGCEMMKFSDYLSGDERSILFEVGSCEAPPPDDKPQAKVSDVVYSVTIPTQERLRLKQKSRSSSGESLRIEGIVLHNMLAEVVTYDDVSQVVQRYVREGRVSMSQASEVRDTLLRLITHPDRSRWFSKDVQVVVETDILKAGEKINRPDRVVIDGDKVTVIDYKFGHRELQSYGKKVALYMKLIREMGYTVVEGYIWYVMKDKLVPVE